MQCPCSVLAVCLKSVAVCCSVLQCVAVLLSRKYCAYRPLCMCFYLRVTNSIYLSRALSMCHTEEGGNETSKPFSQASGSSVAVRCSVLPCDDAACCSVLPCVAVCCSVLQCVAVCCSVLQCVAVWRFECGAECRCHLGVLQSRALRVYQCVAVFDHV